ncbi:unnamed protein product, partial [Prorocentrum cordatum]
AGLRAGARGGMSPELLLLLTFGSVQAAHVEANARSCTGGCCWNPYNLIGAPRLGEVSPVPRLASVVTLPGAAAKDCAFFPCGNTFVGNSGVSQIDYILIPTATRTLVCWATTWRRDAQEGREMAAVLDHTPIVLKMKMAPPGADEAAVKGAVYCTQQIKALKVLTSHCKHMFEARLVYMEGAQAEYGQLRGMAVAPWMARSLAGAGIGIKNCNHCVHPPLAQEWCAPLLWPLVAGGRGGVCVTVPRRAEVLGERYDLLAHDYAPPDAYEVTYPMRMMAQEDPKRTRACGCAIRIYKRRVGKNALRSRDACIQLLKWALAEYAGISQRYTPMTSMDLIASRWSAPVELFKISFSPIWTSILKDYWTKTAGLRLHPAPVWGGGQGMAAPYAQDQRGHLVKRGGAPLPHGFAPDKKIWTRGLAGRRLPHAMCPRWVAWSGAWASLPLLRKSYDAMSATAYGLMAERGGGTRERQVADPEPEARGSAFAAHITSGGGGGMGDTSEPVISMRNYSHAAWSGADFERGQCSSDTSIMVGRVTAVDARSGTFMDDITKARLAPAVVVGAPPANDLYHGLAWVTRGYEQNQTQ